MGAFELGDLVTYRTELVSGAWVSIYGRVMGRMTANSSFMFGMSSVYKYLVKTFVNIPKDFDDVVDWGLRGDHIDLMHMVSENTLVLDWGKPPPKSPKHVWVALEGAELSSIVRHEDREYFKEGGVCPKCGDKGEWRACALFCSFHGQFAG